MVVVVGVVIVVVAVVAVVVVVGRGPRAEPRRSKGYPPCSLKRPK